LEEYHKIKLLGKGGFGTVLLVERTPASRSDGKRDLFAMKRVSKRASKDAGSRRIVEKEVFKNAVGHPFLVQLHLYFETAVLYSF
jgi:serine/threonine protein kinase